MMQHHNDICSKRHFGNGRGNWGGRLIVWLIAVSEQLLVCFVLFVSFFAPSIGW